MSESEPGEPREERRAGHNSLVLGRAAGRVRRRIGFGRERSDDGDDGDARGELLTNSSEAGLITVGKTGSGKGRSSVIPNLLWWGGSAVVLDPKGELCHTTARFRRELGQRVLVFDPFGVVTEEGDRLNPFDLFDLLGGKDQDSEAQSLAEVVGRRATLAKEPFWDLSGHGALSGLISAVASTRPAEERNFRSLMKMFMEDDLPYSLAVMLDTVGKKLTPMARHELASLIGLTEVTRSGVIATADSYLKSFKSEQVLRLLSDSTFSLREFVADEPRHTVYVVVPPTHLQSHFPVVKLLIHVLLKALTTRKVIPPTPTLFLLDEVAQLGSFPLLENVMTVGRGYGVKVWLYLQSIHQLKDNYPQGWVTMLGNCDVLQLFGVDNYVTAQGLAEITGVDPRALLRMSRAEQYLVVDGLGAPALKLDYLRDEMFAGLHDINPYYGGRDVPRAVKRC